MASKHRQHYVTPRSNALVDESRYQMFPRPTSSLPSWSSNTLYGSFNSLSQSVSMQFFFVRYSFLNEKCTNGWAFFDPSNFALLSAILLVQTVCIWCLSVLTLMFSTLTRSPVSGVFLNISWFNLALLSFLVSRVDIFVCR